MEASTKKMFIRAVGDGVSPGSYQYVNGTALESCGDNDEVQSNEEFHSLADELRDIAGFDCDFALLEITYDENGEEISEQIIDWD